MENRKFSQPGCQSGKDHTFVPLALADVGVDQYRKPTLPPPRLALPQCRVLMAQYMTLLHSVRIGRC